MEATSRQHPELRASGPSVPAGSTAAGTLEKALDVYRKLNLFQRPKVRCSLQYFIGKYLQKIYDLAMNHTIVFIKVTC